MAARSLINYFCSLAFVILLVGEATASPSPISEPGRSCSKNCKTTHYKSGSKALLNYQYNHPNYPQPKPKPNSKSASKSAVTKLPTTTSVITSPTASVDAFTLLVDDDEIANSYISLSSDKKRLVVVRERANATRFYLEDDQMFVFNSRITVGVSRRSLASGIANFMAKQDQNLAPRDRKRNADITKEFSIKENVLRFMNPDFQNNMAGFCVKSKIRSGSIADVKVYNGSTSIATSQGCVPWNLVLRRKYRPTTEVSSIISTSTKSSVTTTLSPSLSKVSTSNLPSISPFSNCQTPLGENIVRNPGLNRFEDGKPKDWKLSIHRSNEAEVSTGFAIVTNNDGNSEFQITLDVNAGINLYQEVSMCPETTYQITLKINVQNMTSKAKVNFGIKVSSSGDEKKQRRDIRARETNESKCSGPLNIDKDSYAQVFCIVRSLAVSSVNSIVNLTLLFKPDPSNSEPVSVGVAGVQAVGIAPEIDTQTSVSTTTAATSRASQSISRSSTSTTDVGMNSSSVTSTATQLVSTSSNTPGVTSLSSELSSSASSSAPSSASSSYSLLVSSTSSCAAPTATNFLNDGDFQYQNISGRSSNSRVVFETSAGRNQSTAMQISVNPGSFECISQNITNLCPGRRYFVSLWVLSTSDVLGSSDIGKQYGNVSVLNRTTPITGCVWSPAIQDTSVQEFPNLNSTVVGYQYLHCAFIAERPDMNYGIQFANGNPNKNLGGLTFYVDDLYLTEICQVYENVNLLQDPGFQGSGIACSSQTQTSGFDSDGCKTDKSCMFGQLQANEAVSISQMVQLCTGQTYNLSFWALAYDDGGQAPYSSYPVTNVGHFKLVINGTIIDTQDARYASNFDDEGKLFYTFNFIAQNYYKNLTIMFNYDAPHDSIPLLDVYIDDVYLTDTKPVVAQSPACSLTRSSNRFQNPGFVSGFTSWNIESTIFGFSPSGLNTNGAAAFATYATGDTDALSQSVQLCPNSLYQISFYAQLSTAAAQTKGQRFGSIELLKSGVSVPGCSWSPINTQLLNTFQYFDCVFTAGSTVETLSFKVTNNITGGSSQFMQLLLDDFVLTDDPCLFPPGTNVVKNYNFDDPNSQSAWSTISGATISNQTWKSSPNSMSFTFIPGSQTGDQLARASQNLSLCEGDIYDLSISFVGTNLNGGAAMDNILSGINMQLGNTSCSNTSYLMQPRQPAVPQPQFFQYNCGSTTANSSVEPLLLSFTSSEEVSNDSIIEYADDAKVIRQCPFSADESVLQSPGQGTLSPWSGYLAAPLVLTIYTGNAGESYNTAYFELSSSTSGNINQIITTCIGKTYYLSFTIFNAGSSKSGTKSVVPAGDVSVFYNGMPLSQCSWLAMTRVPNLGDPYVARCSFTSDILYGAMVIQVSASNTTFLYAYDFSLISECPNDLLESNLLQNDIIRIDYGRKIPFWTKGDNANGSEAVNFANGISYSQFDIGATYYGNMSQTVNLCSNRQYYVGFKVRAQNNTRSDPTANSTIPTEEMVAYSVTIDTGFSKLKCAFPASLNANFPEFAYACIFVAPSPLNSGGLVTANLTFQIDFPVKVGYVSRINVDIGSIRLAANTVYLDGPPDAYVNMTSVIDDTSTSSSSSPGSSSSNAISSPSTSDIVTTSSVSSPAVSSSSSSIGLGLSVF